MRKFNTINQEQKSNAQALNEQKVLNDYSTIYSALLEKWNIHSINNLSEDEKKSFNSEINKLWESKKGITNKGIRFIEDRSMFLTESSTDKQKTHYLSFKLNEALSKIISKSTIQQELYNILDEMYKQTNSKILNDVLTTESILNTFNKSLNECISNAVNPIIKDLNENVKQKSKYYIEIKNKPKLNTYLEKSDILDRQKKFESVIINNKDNTQIFETLQSKFFMRDKDDELMLDKYQKLLIKHNLYESFEEFIRKQL